MIILKVFPKTRQIEECFEGWPGFTKPNLPAFPLTWNIKSHKDDLGKSLFWGHSNFGTPKKYLYSCFDSELVEVWRICRCFEIPLDISQLQKDEEAEYKGKIYLLFSCKSWLEGKKLPSIQLQMLNRRENFTFYSAATRGYRMFQIILECSR